MNDTPTRSEYPLQPLGTDRATWRKMVSQNVRQLEVQAGDLRSRLASRYGEDNLGKAEIALAFWRRVRDRDVVRVLESIFGGAIRVREVDDFEGRFQAALDAALDHQSSPHNAVPLSIVYYVEEAVNQTIAQKERGELAELDRAEILFDLGEALLEDRELVRLRIDGSTPDDGATFDEDGKPKLIGRKLGAYGIVRRKGKGGFAEVFEAQHLKLEVPRALKILSNIPPSGSARQKAYEGFLLEAQTQAALDHPNVVRLLDVGDEDGFLFLVMDYVEGRTLAAHIHERNEKEEHYTLAEILDLAIAVAEGLKYAHAHKTVHRDLKPENILIGKDGRVRIGDFGLARRIAESGNRQVTQNGYLIGTPTYMAPEQVGGKKGDTYDHRADIYSFGVVLYHMALGAVPFDDEDIWTILRLHREEAPASLVDQRDDLPLDLEQIVFKCLEKKPEARYADAEELLVDLQACRKSIESGEPVASRAKKGSSRLPVAAGVLVGLVVLLLLTVVFLPGVAGDPAVPEGPETNSEIVKSPPPEPAPPKPSSVEPDPTPAMEEIPKAPPPAPKEIVKAPPKASATPAKAATPKPKPPAPRVVSLRERLLAYPATPEEIQKLDEIADVFARNRVQLHSRSYEKTLTELEALPESGGKGDGGAVTQDGRGYVGAHLEAARRVTEGAKGVVMRRWEELRNARGPVSIKLRDGSVLKGIVQKSTASEIVLTDEKRGVHTAQFGDLAPVEFTSDGALPESVIAYGALSVDAPGSLKNCLDVAGSSQDIALSIPVILRLARETARDLAVEVAVEIEMAVREGKGSENGAARAAFSEARELLLQVEKEILHVYPYLSLSFEGIRREEEMLSFLGSGAYARVLAEGTETAAYPVAARLYHSSFSEKVAGTGVEVLAKTAWHAFGWKLRPDIEELTVKLKYWNVDSQTGAVNLRATADIPRKLLMTRGMSEEAGGVEFRMFWTPDINAGENAEWRFVLRASGEIRTYLRGNGKTIGLYRNSFTAGEADAEITSVRLEGDGGTPRSYALIPAENHLHVFVDGGIVFSASLKDAQIPKQLAFVVTRGTVSIRSVRVLGGGFKKERNQ